LALAVDLGARSVAFPLISSGVYRWPKHDAVRQALTAVQTATVSVDLVRLVLFDAQTYAIAEQVRRELDHPDAAMPDPT
jgi:O-acetyl-ADP-ribose deacetylase (regulator of RNase III)